MTGFNAVLVGGGSAIGAVLRYGIGKAIGAVNHSEFPWSTWVINMVGTLLLGIFFAEFSAMHHDLTWWLLLGSGFCGGFTTFSTMSAESVQLFRTNVLLALLYLTTSLGVGLVLAWLSQVWFA